MPRKTPHITVSAVVPPSMDEELTRLATSKRVSKSQLIRDLLEEKLVEQANERVEDAFTMVEKRLQKIEDRFSALITKAVRVSAQGLYINVRQLEYMEEERDTIDKIVDSSKEYAGKMLEQRSPRKGKSKQKQ